MNKRILFLGTFDPGFGRNRQLQRLATMSGHHCEVKSYNVWGADKVNAASRNLFLTSVKALFAYLRMMGHVLRIGVMPKSRPDFIVIPHPSQIDALFIAPLARVLRVPVVMDFFVSLHETVITDRQLGSQKSVKAFLLRKIDTWSAQWATAVIADTPENADAFSQATNTPREKWKVVRVGADPSIYQPRSDARPEPKSVLFYGTYIPLQGIHTVVRAAKFLPSDYTVRLIGNGQLRSEIEMLVAELRSPVQLIDQVAERELPSHIARAEICLGIFGVGPKTQKVIPNKVYQCLAMGRPVITGASPAVSILKDVVLTVPVGDPEALASAIHSLMENTQQREALASGGRQFFEEHFSEEILAKDFARALPVRQ